MHVWKLLESAHFTVTPMHSGFDYYEPVPTDMTQGVGLACVFVTKPLEAHSHPDKEEIYYIRSGRGLLRVGDEEQIVEKDMVVYIPRNVVHGMTPLDSDDTLSYLFIQHVVGVADAGEAR